MCAADNGAARGQLEEYGEQLAILKARVRLYQEQLDSTKDGSERQTLRGKLASYRAAIKDLQVQIDHLDPPERRKARKAKRQQLNVDGLTYDWFERSGACWSDFEGHSWDQVEAGDFVEIGTPMAQIQDWLREGAARLTDKQALYLDAYYNRGLSCAAIAAEYGVEQSTVSRSIKSGLARMKEWVEAKRLAADCVDGNGRVDWERYLKKTPVLSDRQRQIALLILSGYPKNQVELAEKLGVKQSTVSHTLTRAARTVQKMDVKGSPTSRPRIRDWEHANKYSLALQTGMPLGAYYRYCFRGETVCGMSRYQYELARRRAAGVPAAAAARELGLKPRTVRAAYARLKGRAVPDEAPAPSATEDTIGARLDPETYIKLQRMVAGCADP